MSVMPSNNNGFYLEHTTASAGDFTALLKTENKFVDQDIGIKIITPSASTQTLDASFSSFTIGTPTSGFFHPTATVTISSSISTAGWIASGNSTNSPIKEVGTIPVIELTASTANKTMTPYDLNVSQSTSDSTITSGTTISSSKPASGAYIKIYNNQKIFNDFFTPNITVTTAGYGDSTNKVVTATSGKATIAAVTGYVSIPEAEFTYTENDWTFDDTDVEYDNTTNKFVVDIFGASYADPPIVFDSFGYISDTLGTIHSEPSTLNGTLNKIGIAAAISGTPTKKPTITKHNNTNVSASSATTTQPSSGYYVAISSAKTVNNINAVPTVSSAGYGTTTSGTYTATNSANTEAGALASDVTYVPITAATFANTATTGTTYTDISSTAPVLVSGDYLYINAGYTPARKISLARLIPDATGANATASYILNGYTAFNNDGALITGNIATYTGVYEVV